MTSSTAHETARFDTLRLLQTYVQNHPGISDTRREELRASLLDRPGGEQPVFAAVEHADVATHVAKDGNAAQFCANSETAAHGITSLELTPAVGARGEEGAGRVYARKADIS